MRRMNDITVYIVDDNANHSAGIKQLLELQSDYNVAGISTNGEDAIKRLGELDVDIILMDMNMPETDGVAAIQQILSKKPNHKILALTGYDDPDLIFRAMKNGAKGYILKTMVTSQLMAAIEEVLNNKVYLPPTLATWRICPRSQRKMTCSPVSRRARTATVPRLLIAPKLGMARGPELSTMGMNS